MSTLQSVTDNVIRLKPQIPGYPATVRMLSLGTAPHSEAHELICVFAAIWGRSNDC